MTEIAKLDTEMQIQFRGYPFSRRVEVACGLPLRPRALSLYVSRSREYMWGKPCAETTELAEGILNFVAMRQAGSELPAFELCERFAHEVLETIPHDKPFKINLAEVHAWLHVNL